MAKKSNWDEWNEKKLKKALKKIHTGYTVVGAIFLIIGLALGAFFAQSRIAEDRFVLNGEKNHTLSIGDTLSYTDEGITCVSFGEDVSNSVDITTNMERSADGKSFTGDTSVECEYYIQYKITSGRYEGLSRIRVFTVTSADDGE
ncbi:MAG: hypothetical protein IJY04_06620 [Clostridia bacterium]|nr:hypothetical protein [Clostridia bacterium]